MNSSSGRLLRPNINNGVEVNKNELEYDGNVQTDWQNSYQRSGPSREDGWKSSEIRSQASSGQEGSRRNTTFETESGSENNIRVAVRVRPLSTAEIQRKDKQVLEYPEQSVLWVNSQETTKPFTFNTIFDDKATQTEVFDNCGIKDLIEKALDGFSCTAFAFGQTGSGKTYTITGPFNSESNEVLPSESLFGLIPRSFEYLLSALAKRKESYVIKTAYLEVYNEKVKDLLNPSRARDSLPVRWSSTNGFYVENIFRMECENLEEMMVVLEEGLHNRKIGAHAMNDHSSRSHTMLTIHLDSELNDPDDDVPIIKNGKISFVDLAGSEKVKETNATGEALTESQNINKSLLTLGNCIAALGDAKKRGGHIPYRDSKLTKLLADSLGGDGFTLMLACISPSLNAAQDTLNTLRYANRAKNIKNKPVVKMDPREQLIISMKREMKLLKTENNYFRQQLNIPCSDSQEVITASQIEGVMSSDATCGYMSPAIGSNTLSSLQPSSTNSVVEKQLDDDTPRATTAMYAMSASIGLYDMLQEYINENETLRQRNIELFKSRRDVEKEHEYISMQNESLKQKIGNIERALSSTSLSIHSDDTLSNNGEFQRTYVDEDKHMSSKDGSFNVGFPPIRSGSYPNMISNNYDLAAEVEREHRKIKEERARKQKENQQKLASPSKHDNHRSASDAERVEESQNDLNKIEKGLRVKHLYEENKEGPNSTKDKNVENVDVMQKASADNSENASSESVKQITKSKVMKKKGALEKEKVSNSYAAKFAVKRGFTSMLPHHLNKDSFHDENEHESQSPNETSLYYVPFHELGQNSKAVNSKDSQTINEQLRKDLEKLDGQIQKEVAFKQKRAQPSYHAR